MWLESIVCGCVFDREQCFKPSSTVRLSSYASTHICFSIRLLSTIVYFSISSLFGFIQSYVIRVSSSTRSCFGFKSMFIWIRPAFKCPIDLSTYVIVTIHFHFYFRARIFIAVNRITECAWERIYPTFRTRRRWSEPEFSMKMWLNERRNKSVGNCSQIRSELCAWY